MNPENEIDEAEQLSFLPLLELDSPSSGSISDDEFVDLLAIALS